MASTVGVGIPGWDLNAPEELHGISNIKLGTINQQFIAYLGTYHIVYFTIILNYCSAVILMLNSLGCNNILLSKFQLSEY